MNGGVVFGTLLHTRTAGNRKSLQQPQAPTPEKSNGGICNASLCMQCAFLCVSYNGYTMLRCTMALVQDAPIAALH
eukprot:2492034-Amphidinium_carterae.1